MFPREIRCNLQAVAFGYFPGVDLGQAGMFTWPPLQFLQPNRVRRAAKLASPQEMLRLNSVLD